jgi:hypothetical protein
VSANTGTYTVKGNTLTRVALAAKVVTAMSGQPVTYDFKIDGNTLLLTLKSAAGLPASETRTRLTRVE